ncbi:MAG: hypothetical protein ACMUIG_02145 [Thermoplasmatota archaeon]
MFRRTAARRSLAFIMISLLVILPPAYIAGSAGGGPTRSFPSDIAADNITSHTDGAFIDLAPQFINATFRNVGTEVYGEEVVTNLTIRSPASGSNQSIVHTQEINRGVLDLPVDGTFYQVYTSWTPSKVGSYLINVSFVSSDQFAGNNSFEITLNAFSGNPVGVEITSDVSFKALPEGGSTKDTGYSPYFFYIRNTGYHTDTYNISVRSNWIMGTPPNSTGPVDSGKVFSFSAHVMVPEGTPFNEYDLLSINVSSTTDPSVWSVVNVTTYVQSESAVALDVYPDFQTGYPGGPWLEFWFYVTNIGNRNERYFLTAIANPSSWDIQMNTRVTRPLQAGETQQIKAYIRIPPLNYDTMDSDLTEKGDLGGLVLQAEGEYHATGSAEGKVVVGLVHTVEIEMKNPNKIAPWDSMKPDIGGMMNVTYRIRSINNDRRIDAEDMKVNLELPSGPSGVEFVPAWSSEVNHTESIRWMAGTISNISLKGGEWSPYLDISISYPPYPINGVGYVHLRAEPQINRSVEGMNVSQSAIASVLVKPYYDFILEPPEPPLSRGSPGERLEIAFNITNLGNARDRYVGFSAAIPDEGSKSLPEDWKIFMPNGSRTDFLIPYWYDPVIGKFSTSFLLWVTVPKGAPIGESAVINLTVHSLQNTSIRRSAEVRISVIQGYGVDLEPEENLMEADPNEKVAFRLNVTNTGNGFDIITFTHSIPDLPDWKVEFNSTDVELEPGEQRTITIWVTPSVQSSADQMLSIKIRGTSYFGSLEMLDIFDEVFINTTVGYISGVQLSVLGPGEIWRYPGEIASFQFEIVNMGNGNDTFDLRLYPGAGRWEGAFDLGSGEGGNSVNILIERGGKRTFRVNITLPSLSEASSLEDLQDLDIVAFSEVVNFIEAFPKKDPGGMGEVEFTVGVLQDFKSDISLFKGESSWKEVLPGEEVRFGMVLANLGNGWDNISAIPKGSPTHLSWTEVMGGPYDMAPFESQNLNLSIVPNPNDLPRFHEKVYITLEALSSDGIAYKTVNMTALVVMTRLVTESQDVDLGNEGIIKMILTNMPDPGEIPTPGWPLQKNYSITPRFFTEGDRSRGWAIPNGSIEVIMLTPYESVIVEIPIRAPAELITGSENARVDIDISGGANKNEFRQADARAVFFDIAIDRVTADLYEGGDGIVNIFMTASGTRGQESVPIMVYVGNEAYGPFFTGSLNPELFTQDRFIDGHYFQYGEQEHFQKVEVEIPTLKWYEKGMEIELRIVVDPDNAIRENTPRGSLESESNNVYSERIDVKNYSPSAPLLILLGILLLIFAVGGIIGYFFLDRRDSWFLLPLSMGFIGLFALLFYIPLEKGGDLSLANGFGIAIIILDMVVIIPAMIYMFTRSGDAYILHVLSEKRGRELPETIEKARTALKPYLISGIGGMMAGIIPLSFWILPSYIRDEGVLGIASALADMDSGFPIWILALIIPVLSLLAQFILISLKKGSLNRVTRAWDDLERLRSEIEEGFQ